MNCMKSRYYFLLSTIINGNNQFIPFVNNSFTPKSYTLLQDGDLILADASEDRKDVGRPVEMIIVDLKPL